jgi:GNAT superfamily N-acetyltransferase
MRLVPCTEEAHSGAILAILNEAIVTSTALYDYKPRTAENMVAWFATKRANGFPVIGAVDDDSGKLLGFASYGAFRAFPAYKYTVEHSVYVDSAHRGEGLGRTLMEAHDRRGRCARRARDGRRHRCGECRQHRACTSAWASRIRARCGRPASSSGDGSTWPSTSASWPRR